MTRGAPPSPLPLLHLPLPQPSINKGRIQLQLEPSVGGCSAFTARENARVSALERSLSSPTSVGLSSGAPASAKSGLSAEQRNRATDAATEQRNRAFADSLSQIDEMMRMLQCNGGGGKAPDAGGAPAVKRAAVESSIDGSPRGLTAKQERQRMAATRLWLGIGSATTAAAAAMPLPELPPAERAERVAPAKKVEARLKVLRTDPVARRTLKEQVAGFIELQLQKRRELSGGKNFIAINVVKATEPLRYSNAGSALVPEGVEVSVPWRPASGAPAYRRPGSAPVAPAWRKKALGTAPLSAPSSPHRPMSANPDTHPPLGPKGASPGGPGGPPPPTAPLLSPRDIA